MKSRKNRILKSATLLLAVAAGIVTNAQTTDTPDVQTIVDKANHTAYYQGDDGRAQVTMTIIDSQERERLRKFTILRRDEPAPDDASNTVYTGDQKMYVYFQEPADVNKMVFMVWKHIESDDDRWLYLPALDLVKRIAASDKRTSFVGSHFFYEDVSGRTPDLDSHELVETTDKYYVVKSTPKNTDLVEFAYYKSYIHPATFLPFRTEYYDKNDTMYRLYEALQVENIQGFTTVTKSKMTDIEGGGHTRLEYNDVTYDIGLPDNIFTERYLRRPPRKFLR